MYQRLTQLSALIRNQLRLFNNSYSVIFPSRFASISSFDDLESKFSPTLVNRNPRNLELMRIARRRKGWELQFPSRSYYYKVLFEKTNTNTTARVIHWESHAVGSPVAIVNASTREPAIRAQLYSASDVSAAQNIGRVLARRCLQCGIEAVHFERSEYVLDELSELERAEADREFYPDNTLVITHSNLSRLELEERLASKARPGAGVNSEANAETAGSEQQASKSRPESGKKSKKTKPAAAASGAAAETPASPESATDKAEKQAKAAKKQESKATTAPKGAKEETPKPAEATAAGSEAANKAPKAPESAAPATTTSVEKKGKKSKAAAAPTDSPIAPKQVAAPEAPKQLEAGLANQSIAAFCEAMREAGVELQERPVLEAGAAPEEAEAYSEWRAAAAWDEREQNASPEGSAARAPTLLERVRSEWDWSGEQWGYKRRPRHPDELQKNRNKRVLFDNTTGRLKKPEHEYRY